MILFIVFLLWWLLFLIGILFSFFEILIIPIALLVILPFITKYYLSGVKSNAPEDMSFHFYIVNVISIFSTFSLLINYKIFISYRPNISLKIWILIWVLINFVSPFLTLMVSYKFKHRLNAEK